MEAAEDQLSYGKTVGEDIKEIPPMMPPSIVARQRIALAIDSIITNDYSYKDIARTLTDIRNDPYVPRYLKVEAGYILSLAEKMERTRQSLEKSVKKGEQCAQENAQMKEELNQLKYKLEKIEEIHIDIEKRRGKQ